MKEQMLQMGFGVTNGKDRFFEMFYLSEAGLYRRNSKKVGLGSSWTGLNIVLCGKMEDSIFLKEHLLRRVWMF